MSQSMKPVKSWPCRAPTQHLYDFHMERLLPYLLDFEVEIARSKDIQRAKDFWAKLAWEVQTCNEAAELFPDMVVCPICLNGIDDGYLRHKHPINVLN